MTRDLHYKVCSFRLSEKTVEKLRELKKGSDLSYNLLLSGMAEQFKLQKYVEKRERIQSKRKSSVSNLPEETNL
jgi:hypothetical protein